MELSQKSPTICRRFEEENMEDREIRLRAANQRSKAYIIARVNEILDDYLMDDDEDLAIIDFKFKKGDEHQEKHLIWRRKES